MVIDFQAPLLMSPASTIVQQYLLFGSSSTLVNAFRRMRTGTQLLSDVTMLASKTAESEPYLQQ